MNICAAIFAHNEERRIGSCLKSLPLDRMDITFHVLVNGSNDRTADRARPAAGGRTNVHIHELHPGGKSRTWKRFVFGMEGKSYDVVIFMDGGAEIKNGAIDAFAATLAMHPHDNAARGMRPSGRTHLAFQADLRKGQGQER